MSAQSLSERTWQALEGRVVSLIPEAGDKEANAAPLKSLAEAAIADFLALLGDTLETRIGAMASSGAVLDRIVAILRTQTRPGQSWTGGTTSIEVAEGKNDAGNACMTYVLATASEDRPGGRVFSIGASETSQSRSCRMSLPFDFAALHDVDAAERMAVWSVARDGDDIFVSKVTVRSGACQKLPSDFGLLIKMNGDRQWLHGSYDLASAALKAPLAESRSGGNVADADPVVSKAESLEGSIAAAPMLKSPQPAAQGAPTVAKKCANCRASILPNAVFCPFCGSAADGSQKSDARQGPPRASQCAGCGSPVQQGAQFCARCGRPVGAVAWPTDPGRTIPPHLCPKCGADNTLGARFCRGCGSPLATSSRDASRHCPACGNPIKPDAQFCRGCGKPVGAR